MKKIFHAAYALIASGMLVCPVQNASAVAAYPGIQRAFLADGTSISYRVVGDEYSHAFVSADGFFLERDENGIMSIKGEANVEEIMEKGKTMRVRQNIPGPSFPTTGNLRGVVLMVEFFDNSFVDGHDKELYDLIMNSERYSGGGATGSARDYFVDQSMGVFTPTFDVVGPIKLSKTMQYYGGNDRYGQDKNPGAMVKEACEYASAELGVDFSEYDYNEDGAVDFVYIIYAGYAESYGASSNTIWPHASDLYSLGVECEVSGKTVRKYACSSELKYVSGETIEGIGTFCHEFGHVLGLPDLYNTRSAGDIQLGSWDIMDQGSYNNESHTPPAYSAFERYSLGWLDLTEIDTPSECVSLEELTVNNNAYRISTPNEDEFFVLENRQQVGWDAFHAGKGLMITHIVYDSSAWASNYVNSGLISRVDIEEADGSQTLASASGDLYPYGGNDMFTDYSSPSSITHDGLPTNKGVTQIQDNEGVVTFRFMNDRLNCPENLLADGIGTDWFSLSWDPVEEASYYKVNIREILPDDLNPVVYSEDFSKMESGAYPNADMTDIGNSLDDFMTTSGWAGESVYQAGGRVMVGYYAKSGTLQSPAFDFGVSEEATIGFSVVSYPGKSVNYSLSLVDASDSREIEKYEGKATKTEENIVWHVGGLPEKVKCIFDTRNERAYFDNLVLLKGNIADELVWNSGPELWTEDNVVATSLKVTGLRGGRSYACTVEAWSSDGLYPSCPSEEIVVVTGDNGGVEDLESGVSSEVVATIYYDVLGRRYSHSIAGTTIIKVTVYSDGSRKTEKNLTSSMLF